MILVKAKIWHAMQSLDFRLSFERLRERMKRCRGLKCVQLEGILQCNDCDDFDIDNENGSIDFGE
jgi:hypothetical protein